MQRPISHFSDSVRFEVMFRAQSLTAGRPSSHFKRPNPHRNQPNSSPIAPNLSLFTCQATDRTNGFRP